MCKRLRINKLWVPVLLKIHFYFAFADELQQPCTSASITSATRQSLVLSEAFSRHFSVQQRPSCFIYLRASLAHKNGLVSRKTLVADVFASQIRQIKRYGTHVSTVGLTYIFTIFQIPIFSWNRLRQQLKSHLRKRVIFCWEDQLIPSQSSFDNIQLTFIFF